MTRFDGEMLTITLFNHGTAGSPAWWFTPTQIDPETFGDSAAAASYADSGAGSPPSSAAELTQLEILTSKCSARSTLFSVFSETSVIACHSTFIAQHLRPASLREQRMCRSLAPEGESQPRQPAQKKHVQAVLLRNAMICYVETGNRHRHRLLYNGIDNQKKCGNQTAWAACLYGPMPRWPCWQCQIEVDAMEILYHVSFRDLLSGSQFTPALKWLEHGWHISLGGVWPANVCKIFMGYRSLTNRHWLLGFQAHCGLLYVSRFVDGEVCLLTWRPYFRNIFWLAVTEPTRKQQNIS